VRLQDGLARLGNAPSTYLSMHADSSKVVDWFAVVAECMRKQRLA
jgi:hypothetical protein